MNKKYLFSNNDSDSINKATKTVHDIQVELLQALEEDKLICSIKGFDDIVYKASAERVEQLKIDLEFFQMHLERVKINCFIDSAFNYINKNKLNKYSRDDINNAVLNSKLKKQFKNTNIITNCIYNIINSDGTGIHGDLYHISKNFIHCNEVYDAIKQQNLLYTYDTIGILITMCIALDLTDVA
jgi:hypothetical protein